MNSILVVGSRLGIAAVVDAAACGMLAVDGTDQPMDDNSELQSRETSLVTAFACIPSIAMSIQTEVMLFC